MERNDMTNKTFAEWDTAVLAVLAAHPTIDRTARDVTAILALSSKEDVDVFQVESSLERLSNARYIDHVGAYFDSSGTWARYVYVQPIGTPRLRIATGHDGAMILRIDAPAKHRVYVNDVLVSGVVATDDTLTTWKQVS